MRIETSSPTAAGTDVRPQWLRFRLRSWDQGRAAGRGGAAAAAAAAVMSVSLTAAAVVAEAGRPVGEAAAAPRGLAGPPMTAVVA